ncbi:MAG: hypothetical protein JJ974_03555 [Phycisphaerales bacterium]|nr:hypothetical protein [Phycisphaerales bacterium]
MRLIPGLTAVVLVCVAALSAPASGAEPILETITYQGLLQDGGQPANGMYDIQIQYYDELGNPFVATTTYLDFEVVDGLLSFPIDYVNVFTTGERRFLQIRVRPAGTTVFSDLSPRQELQAAPYAVYAIKAGDAETAGVADTSLDNEWSRSGSIVSALAGVDQVLFKPALTGGAMLNSFTEMQINFDDSSFGGIYINSQNSGGSPFYGFAMDNTFEAYIEYRESLDQIRFFNSGGFLPALTLGNTTATVPTLVAENEIVKDFGTSEYHRNGPIAYGSFNFDGSKYSGTPNISAVWDSTIGRYIVDVQGEFINFTNYTIVVTPSTSNPVIAVANSFSGDAVVYFHSLASQNISSRFNIVIYKNEPVTAID